LTEYQIAGPANLPSCSRTKNSISRRVIRVITKDINAVQGESHFTPIPSVFMILCGLAITEMNKNFDEVYNRMGDGSKKDGHKNKN